MSTTQYSQIPQVEVPLTDQGKLHRAWYRHFADIFQGKPPASESVVVPGSSPFTYAAKRKGFLIVHGGTVTMTQFARSTTNYNTGQTAGTFPLSQGDSLVITYSSAPSLTFVPQ